MFLKRIGVVFLISILCANFFYIPNKIQQEKEDAAVLTYEIAEIKYEPAVKKTKQIKQKKEQQTLIIVDEQQQQPRPAAKDKLKKVKYTSYLSCSFSLDIVNYAKQFIGNPYVWGGNSLTEGCDCSHFVWNVLKDTGHYDGAYATSDGWAYLGQPISSLDQARAGDIIVYPGHVAIYDGCGSIIQAKGEQYGITYDRAATCNTIIAIRRF